MKTSSAIRVLNGNTRAVDKRLVRLQKFIFYLYIYIYIQRESKADLGGVRTAKMYISVLPEVSFLLSTL